MSKQPFYSSEIKFDKLVVHKLPISNGIPSWVSDINGPEKHFLTIEQHYNTGLIPVKVIEPQLRYPYALLYINKDKDGLIYSIPYLRHYNDKGELRFEDELPINVTVDFVDEENKLIEQNTVNEKYVYSKGGKRRSKKRNQKKSKKNHKKRKSRRHR